MYSVKSRAPSIIRKMPMTIPTRSGTTITITPKTMHKTAKIGLEMVIPIFLSPFSTTFVNAYSPFYTCNSGKYLRHSKIKQ